ncbi:MAG: ABC transporter substrate-binding protein [Fimbriimonadaceae bacterium]
MGTRIINHRFWAGSGIIAAFAVLGLAGSGCGSGTDNTASSTGSTATGAPKFDLGTEGDIKIGLVAALNGDLKPWGQDSQSGVELAVDEFNRAGGFNGKKVQLLVEDSNSRPEVGKSAAEKLISEGCIVILGEVASGITGAMGEATKDKKVPQIAVGATRTDLTTGNDYMFRVCYTDALQGPVMAKFAYDELHLRNVAMITDEKQPYSTGLSDAFAAFFKKLGGTIVDEEKYNTGQTQFSGQLTNVKAKNPDGVFCSGYFTEVGPIVKQAREAGIDKHVPFLGGDGWDSKEIVNSGGDAIIGSFFCNHYNNKDTSPAVVDFLAKWTKAFNGSLPGTTMGALGYDAAGVALDALKRAKSATPQDLRDAIDATDNFHGVSGDITLKGHHGDPPKRAIVVELTSDKQNPQVFRKAYNYADVFGSNTAVAAPAALALPKK